MRRALLVLTAAAGLTLTACGGGSTDDGGDSGTLRPASDVLQSSAAANADTAKIGDTLELGPVKVIVSNAVAGGDDLGPWLAIQVRVENPTTKDQMGPTFSIICAGKSSEGSWQADSTFAPQRDIPKGSFDEGTVNLLRPDDSRTGENPPACATPAELEVSELNGDEAIRMPLADSVIAELNAFVPS